MLGDVGRWAITSACAAAQGWPETVRVAVNVPVLLFLADDFVVRVSEAVEAANLSPRRLDLEMSEAVFFGDADVVDRTLSALFKLCVRRTLDEFGSGYSSLAYLRRAPFDAIKIDQKLVTEAERHDSRVSPYALAAGRSFSIQQGGAVPKFGYSTTARADAG